MKSILILSFIALLLAGNAHCEFSATDMHSLSRLGEYAVSKTGQVVYALTTWDKTKDASSSVLKILGTNFFHTGTNRNSNPVFAPSESDIVFFLDSSSGVTKVMQSTMAPPLNRAQTLTNYPISVSNLKAFDNYIVFTADVYKDCAADFACTANRDARAAKNPNGHVIYDSLYVRHWDIYVTPGKSSQLFTQAIVKAGTGFYVTQGQPQMITAGLPDLNCPVPPDGGKPQFDICPEGDKIAFTVSYITHNSSWNTAWLIYQAQVNPANGNLVKTAECVTCNYGGPRTTNPAYSPDAKTIAYLSMDRPGYEADRYHIVLFNIASKEHTPIALHWDRSVSEMVWNSNGKELMVAADENGNHKLFSVAVPSGNHRTLVNSGSVGSVTFPKHHNRTYYVHNTFSRPSDLYSINLSDPRQESNLNPGLNALEEGAPFYFRSETGDQVQSWIIKPSPFDGNHTYPVVMLIHGGPQGAWNSGWSYRWNPQLWSQRGYAVIMINPHGSTGFGQRFTDAVRSNWGGTPFRDLMTGLEAAIHEFPWMDRNRLAACGASYGGYMINWINGQAPKTFSSLVVHDGRYDMASSYGSTDELYFPEWEFEGTPWSNAPAYAKWAPSAHVAKWQTPTLVIHGGKDFRVTQTQGMSTFSALQRRGIPSRFLYFPLENHWVSKASNSVKWYQEVLGWLDTHTKSKQPGK